VSAHSLALPPWILGLEYRVRRNDHSRNYCLAPACGERDSHQWANGAGRELMFSTRFMDFPLPRALRPYMRQRGELFCTRVTVPPGRMRCPRQSATFGTRRAIERFEPAASVNTCSTRSLRPAFAAARSKYGDHRRARMFGFSVVKQHPIRGSRAQRGFSRITFP